MELRQLHYFLTVFEERSVTRAAHRMNVVQPALSHQITRLEQELGSKLFHRTPKGMVPTDAGNEAYRLFSAVLRDLGAARQSLREADGSVRGRITLGVVSSITNNVLAEALLSFHAKYPEVTVHATGGLTPELHEMLRTGQLDLIVVNASRRARSPEMEDLLSEDLAVIAAAPTPLPEGGRMELGALAGQKLVLPSARHGLRTIIDRAAFEFGLPLLPGLELDDLNVIESFVGGSDFLTILPPLAVHQGLRSGRLKALQLTPAIPRRLVCMTAPERPRTRVADLLILELRDRITDFSLSMPL